MGKNLIQQARGKGGPSYRSPGFKFKGSAKIRAWKQGLVAGTVVDIVKCPGHAAPLAEIEYEDGETCLLMAAEGMKVGDVIQTGQGAELRTGNVPTLKDIPEGTAIYNIESQPGDGGKFCRTPGTAAKIVSKTEHYAVLLLPSKKERLFNINCRACIGTIAASGVTEKPILKAGKAHHMRRGVNKRYPMISAAAQNAVDHPFGNKRTSRKSKQRPTSKFAPPGRKVGKLWPKSTGRGK